MESWDGSYSDRQTVVFDNEEDSSSNLPVGRQYPTRTTKEILRQCEARYAELRKIREKMRREEEQPFLLYPCTKCLHFGSRDNDRQPPFVCGNKLVAGFDKSPVLGWRLGDINLNIPHLCGLEKPCGSRIHLSTGCGDQ